MNDGELIANWEPKGAGHVLILGFDDFEEMLLFQERVQAEHRLERDDTGEELPQVETLWMGQAQFGKKPMFGGDVVTALVVSTAETLQNVEETRRAWAHSRMLVVSPLAPKQGLSYGWTPSTDQMDMLERFAAEVVEPNPAGSGGGTARIKTSVARAGFNFFCLDKDRPDLQFTGTSGGKAFSETIRAMFQDEVSVRQSEGGHPYIHGLRRREGVNRKYFRLP